MADDRPVASTTRMARSAPWSSLTVPGRARRPSTSRPLPRRAAGCCPAPSVPPRSGGPSSVRLVPCRTSGTPTVRPPRRAEAQAVAQDRWRDHQRFVIGWFRRRAPPPFHGHLLARHPAVEACGPLVRLVGHGDLHRRWKRSPRSSCSCRLNPPERDVSARLRAWSTGSSDPPTRPLAGRASSSTKSLAQEDSSPTPSSIAEGKTVTSTATSRSPLIDSLAR